MLRYRSVSHFFFYRIGIYLGIVCLIFHAPHPSPNANSTVWTSKITFLRQFFKNFAYFKKKIYLIELGSDFVISTENAYLASILSGNVKAISGIVTAHISAQRPEAKIESNVATGFCENMLYFEVKVDLFICLFDLIWAFFKALFTRSTYV